MFKKPLSHQSNATPLRSSARRQLLNAIFEQYPSLLGKKQNETPVNPTTTHQPSGAGSENIETTDEKVTSTSAPGQESEGLSEKELGKLILPDGVRISNFETSAEVQGTFWLSPDGDPLWMTFGRNSKEYIPTLSLLSQPLPNPPLPILQLHNPLPPPILTGAPLFIPAVRNLSTPWLIPDIQEGQLVAFVSSASNGTANVQYIGVGRVVAKGGMRSALERRIDNLRNEGGEKEEGKFADILCIIDDHLWEMGNKPPLTPFELPIPPKALAPPPSSNQAGPSSSPRSSSSSSSPTARMNTLNIDDDRDEVKPNSESASDSTSAISSAPLTSSEISTLLSISLLQALTTLQPSLFPLPASLLYSAHVLPNRPAYIPKDKRDEVVIAKSEWKKLTKWMKEVSKEGLLKIKESKGEVIVQSFDPQHPSLQNHNEFTTVSQEEAKAAKKAARDAAKSAGTGVPASAKGKEKDLLVIEELWKPTGAASSFWEAAGVDKSALHPPSEMKVALDSYLAKNNLVLPNDHRYILLDDELGRAVGLKKPEPGQKMARDEIMKKLKSGVSWNVSLGGVIKKGTLQPITMSVKTRQGRKTVTHVWGLETFDIDIDAFAEELRKKCAGSASVGLLPGSSPKLNLQEIQVQGSQVKLITESLANKGIPKKWIKEAEDSKKKK
uniref:Translation initiation factor 2D n=1 Tax=Kwoniella dejecticola CBS 10117 TaxID=1296121 RepID=A0A1A6A4B1_9TREE|nr:translation initiation factor 2D [Kwoniella dejecticola CBS 10117]OBR84905.1 translation initiation factor 2D [Kwoniella dejecticola CBS 10117]